MSRSRTITLRIHWKDVTIDVDSVLYVIMKHGEIEIHLANGDIHEVMLSLTKIEEMLGEGFVRIQRSCIVAARAVYSVGSKVELVNGESLVYSKGSKDAIIESLRVERQRLINSAPEDDKPSTDEEYRQYYSGLDHLPFAFTDIEMMFDEDSHAVDWIFRYGNPALAKLEKVPLKQLVGRSFSSVFRNMDQKWLQAYERAALFGETLEMIDYSPEIDAYIKIIAFPTFRGHCGVILFDLSEIKFTKNNADADNALLYYLGVLKGK